MQWPTRVRSVGAPRRLDVPGMYFSGLHVTAVNRDFRADHRHGPQASTFPQQTNNPKALFPTPASDLDPPISTRENPSSISASLTFGDNLSRSFLHASRQRMRPRNP